MAKNPKQASASHSLRAAEIKLQKGKLTEAVHALQVLLRSGTENRAASILLGQALVRMGQAGAAIEVLRQALQKAPADADLTLRLGNLLASMAQWNPARICYEGASRLQPDNATCWYNLGICLKELGQLPDAIAAFEAAIALDPRYAAAFYALGLCYVRLEAHEAALLAFECSVELEPAEPRHRVERARTWLALRRPRDALRELEQLGDRLRIHAEALNLQGVAWRQLGDADRALDAYNAAIDVHSNFAEALSNRGNLLLIARRLSSALNDIQRALALAPDTPWLRGLRLYAAMHVHDWEDYEPQVAAIVSQLQQGRPTVQPLILQGLVDDPAAQRNAARVWIATAVQTPSANMPALKAKPDGRIRLAYVSRDFKAHPVSYLMAEVIELHDRSRFEVIAINHGRAKDDGMQLRLRKAFDAFIDVENLSDDEIAQNCRKLEVDIAVDLTGFTEGARGGIFARRIAPIQILYLGYLGGSGSVLYDYLIADLVLIPTEERPHYDERIIYLTSYQANDRRRPRPELEQARDELGLPIGGFVFCCFNNPCKLTPQTFDTWTTILRQVPDSVLWLLAEDDSAQVRLRAKAERRGISGKRLVFASRCDRATYLARLKAADLFLDTLPYNAGATASDALWMGLPVLTQAGRSFPARVAASLLRAAGLPDLIAGSKEAYVDTAIALARQPAQLAVIKKRLAEAQSDCLLFDTPKFTRTLESAYLEAYQRRLGDCSPADILVQAPQSSSARS